MATGTLNQIVQNSKNQNDWVYNTESTLIVNSNLRNKTQWPNAFNYTVNLQNIYGSISEVTLTKAIINYTPPLTSDAFWLCIDEFDQSYIYTPNYPNNGVITIIPVQTNSAIANQTIYLTQTRTGDLDAFPKCCRKNTSSLTIRWLDDNGNPYTNIGEHILKFYIRSYY